MTKHLHNLLTATGMLMLCLFAALPARAWTAQTLAEYCQGNAMELITSYGNDNSLGMKSDSYGVSDPNNVQVSWGTMSNGTEVFIVKNFLGAFTVYFTVSGNTIKGYKINNRLWYTTSGNAIKFAGLNNVYCMQIERAMRIDAPTVVQGGYRYYGVHADRKVKAYNYNCWNYVTCNNLNSLNADQVLQHSGFTHNNWYDNQRTTWEGTISYDDNGDVLIQFGPYLDYYYSNSIVITYGDINENGLGTSIIDGYMLTLFKSNATATDSKNTTAYNVRYKTIEGNAKYNFGITNFAKLGMMYGNYNVNNPQTSSNAPYTEWDIIKGKITGNKVVIPQQNTYAVFTGRMNQYNDESVMKNTNYFTIGFDPNTQQPRADKAITGTISYDGTPHHDANSNTWHYNLAGGSRHTYVGGATINLDPFGFTDNNGKTTSWGNTYQGMCIQLEDETDCTFDCNLTLTDVSHNPDTDYIIENGEKKGYYKATINLFNLVNPDYVSELEVYCVPGKYSYCNNIPLESAAFVTSTSIEESDAEIVLPNKKFFPVIDANGKLATEYTFFVRAKYKTATNAPGYKGVALSLSDTHHSPILQDVSFITTGVNGIVDNGMSIEKTQNGVIVSAPQDMPVEVYNMAGMKVAQGTANNEITLGGKGVFMVKAGAKVFKIVK